MRSIVLALIAALLPLSLSSLVHAEQKRPKIGLVLEGGGALGFAHVGVIKVLEEERIPIDFIAGTSMGSIVGAAYASGRTVPELEDVMSTTDWDKLFNEAIPRRLLDYRQKSGRDSEIYGNAKIGIKDGDFITGTAMVEGQHIEPLFQELFRKVPANTSFDALPIPYRAVAADIVTGDTVVLDRGSLALAARASMSVPGFFSPVEIDGRLLVDGGVTNNFPIDVAKKMGADIIIGVEFGTELKNRHELTGPLGITGQILNLLLARTSSDGIQLMGPQDIRIHPELKGYTSTSFSKADEIMKAGEAAARLMVPALKRLSVPQPQFDAYQAKRISGEPYAPIIDYVRIEGADPARSTAIATSIETELGQPANYREIEAEVQKIYESGEYRSVGYDIEEKDGKHGLVIKTEDKDWLKNYLRLGFALEDDFQGESNYRLAAETRMRDLNSWGAYLNLQAEVGASPRLAAELYQPLGEGSPFFVAPEFVLSRRDLYLRENGAGDIIAEYERKVAYGGLKGGLSLGEYGEWYVGWRRGSGRLDRHIGDGQIPNFDYEIGEFVSRLAIDQLDNPDFPTEGFRMGLFGTVSRDGVGASSDFEQGRISGGVPLTVDSTTVLLSGEFASSSENLSPERSYSLGGFFDISGFAQDSLTADEYWIGRAALYHRFEKGSSSILTFGGYYGGTFEYATLRSQLEQVGDNTGIVAGSVFIGADTPLLPVYLGFGLNNESNQSFYLAVGRLAGRVR